VPVAANWRVVPFTFVGLEGEIVSVDNVDGVTVIVVDAAILFTVAVIVAVPLASPVASPLLPDALLIDTTEVLFDVHVTFAVRS
jgi:hypothetical protein